MAAGILVWTGCSSSARGGVSVDIVSMPVELTRGMALPATAEVEVRLDDVFWTNGSLELVACPSLAGRVLDFVVPPARAHGEGPPTRSAEPVLQSAFSTEAAELGTLRPPAGRYCSITYRMGPADHDAIDLEAMPEMLGLSVLVRGAFRQSGGQWQSFNVESAAELNVETPALSIDLSRSRSAAQIRVSHDPREWWTGIDFLGSAIPAEREAILLDNIEHSVRIDVE